MGEAQVRVAEAKQSLSSMPCSRVGRVAVQRTSCRVHRRLTLENTVHMCPQ